MSSSPSTPMPRPIATNSRIKQDERLRKDMHLAFVNNALQQKALVRLVLSVVLLQTFADMERGARSLRSA